MRTTGPDSRASRRALPVGMQSRSLGADRRLRVDSSAMDSFATALINLAAFRANLDAFRRRVPAGTPLCPALKANGYGHGIEVLLPVLAEARIEAVAVAQLEEALQARKLGWRHRILCLGGPVVADTERERLERAREAIAARIECTVSSDLELTTLAKAAQQAGQAAAIQIKMDSGMGRLGVRCEHAPAFLHRARCDSALTVAGVYTHFATADDADLTFAREQLAVFRQTADAVRASGGSIPAFHAANSAAAWRLPDAALDMIRPGLGIYGYWCGPEAERPAELRPILRLVSRIVAVRPMPAGAPVGYGCTFRTQRDSVIGVIPVGYADGYSRQLSGRSTVTMEVIRGRARTQVPLVGRVSMDLITVDLTGVPDLRPGDPVILYDDAVNAPNSVEAIARGLGTIPYEITCAIGSRVRRLPAEVM